VQMSAQYRLRQLNLMLTTTQSVQTSAHCLTSPTTANAKFDAFERHQRKSLFGEVAERHIAYSQPG
jgi:hypothetical protein